MIKALWNSAKNEWLKKKRGISFEEILKGVLLDAEEHPKRKNQQLLYFKINDYVWIVPAVENRSEFFLKTAYPSRKATKYLRKGEKYEHRKNEINQE